MGRAAAGLRGAAARGLGDGCGAARLPGRTGAALAAPRPVVVHRRGTQDRRGQVRQDEDPRQLRARRLYGGRGALTPRGASAGRRGAAAVVSQSVWPALVLCGAVAGTGTLMRTAWSTGGFA